MEIAVFTAPKAFMSHANARLTVHGRLLLVQRVAAAARSRMWPASWGSCAVSGPGGESLR